MTLLATAVVFRDGTKTVVIIGADVVGLTTEIADRVRARVGEVAGCDPAAVLLNSSHTHAAPWPGATIKLGGAFDGWTETELRYRDAVPHVATPDDHPFGGYEPALSHRGYGQPAPFSPEVAGIIERTALDRLKEVFA